MIVCNVGPDVGNYQTNRRPGPNYSIVSTWSRQCSLVTHVRQFDTFRPMITSTVDALVILSHYLAHRLHPDKQYPYLNLVVDDDGPTAAHHFVSSVFHLRHSNDPTGSYHHSHCYYRPSHLPLVLAVSTTCHCHLHRLYY